jgi:hypothetical protein
MMKKIQNISCFSEDRDLVSKTADTAFIDDCIGNTEMDQRTEHH